MQYLCTAHVYMYMCTHVHAHVCSMRLYTSLLYLSYAAILVNRPSGISQAAALAVNRTKGVK